MFREWKRYVSAAERRRNAERVAAKSTKKGQSLSPVRIAGRAIARTFWGKAWCQNLERYSDFDNRLPRGRTYVRNGAVLDLRIAAGEVKAQVVGSAIYQVRVNVSAVPTAHWKAVCKDCAGTIDSLVELLQGRFSKGVMERICRQETGLFPAPKEITFDCSCPDWASMCKHVAAVLYAVGARLDEKPELLFALRQVDEQDLLANAGTDLPLTGKGTASGKMLGDVALDELFGIEMAQAVAPDAAARVRAATPKRATSAPTPTATSATTAPKASTKIHRRGQAQRRKS